jgi:hypothetical protein
MKNLPDSRSLFQMTAKNGADYTFASLRNGDCAILCDGVTLEKFPGTSDETVRRGVLRFRRLVQLAEVGVARSPLAQA